MARQDTDPCPPLSTSFQNFQTQHRNIFIGEVIWLFLKGTVTVGWAFSQEDTTSVGGDINAPLREASSIHDQNALEVTGQESQERLMVDKMS